MAVARQEDNWNHTALLVAQMIACVSGEEVPLSQIHPCLSDDSDGEEKALTIRADNIHILKQVFVDNQQAITGR